MPQRKCLPFTKGIRGVHWCMPKIWYCDARWVWLFVHSFWNFTFRCNEILLAASEVLVFNQHFSSIIMIVNHLNLNKRSSSYASRFFHILSVYKQIGRCSLDWLRFKQFSKFVFVLYFCMLYHLVDFSLLLRNRRWLAWMSWWSGTFVGNMLLEHLDFFLKTHNFMVHLAYLGFKSASTLKPVIWFGFSFFDYSKALILFNCYSRSLKRRSLRRLRRNVHIFVFAVSHKRLERPALLIMLKKCVACIIWSRGKFCTRCRGYHLIDGNPMKNQIASI